MRLWVAVVMLAGCDRVFQLTPVELDDPTADARPVDARVRPDGEPSGCPADYMLRTDSTASVYKVVLSTETWLAAEADCANDMPTGKTHLIVLSNRDEWLSLITVPATFLVDDTWIGASALTNGNNSYLWVTAEDTNAFVVPAVKGLEPWESDQPDATNGDGCGELRALSGSLHDEDCSSSSNYICECDGHPEVPANF